jgi:hypothetical protein
MAYNVFIVDVVFIAWIFEYHLKMVYRLGGVVVSVMATESKGCEFKTRPRRWIFKSDKSPQPTFLSDGK